MLQKEYNAGKQLIKDLNDESLLNIPSNSKFDNLENIKSSSNTYSSLEINNLKSINSFNDMKYPTVEENNKLQIKDDRKHVKHMMRFFSKQSKNQGYYVMC